MRIRFVHLFVLALSTAGVHPLPLAQGVPDLDLQQQRLLEREEQQRKQLQSAPDVRSKESPTESVLNRLPVESPCFVIHDLALKVRDGDNADFSWLASEMTSSVGFPPVIGECIGAKGIAALIEQAQNRLVDRGFVTTRVLAGDQDLSSGKLTLTVIPGRIRAIRLKAADGSRTTSLSTTLPLRAGDVLNIRNIEQGLENLKRAPTAEADIQIQPAEGEGSMPGESDLVVAYRQTFPFRLTLTADDSGTKSTGKYQGSVTVSGDNLLQLSDLFYYTRNNDLGGGLSGARGTRGDTFHYSLPFGSWLIGVTLNDSSYNQSVAGLNQTYVYRGTSQNNDAKVSRMIFRNANQKLSLAFGVFQRKTNNYIDDTEVQNQRRVEGGWYGSTNYKLFIGGSTLEGTLTYKKGTGAFGSLPAPEDPFGEGTSHFALTTAELNVTAPFKFGQQQWRYNANVRIQNDRTPLTPLDRFSIGGRYTVRGFDGESLLSGDSGWLWRNDLSWALSAIGSEIYIGVDHGEVGGASSDLLIGKYLTGGVIGIRGAISKLNYDLFIGRPLRKPDYFVTASYVTGFSLMASF